MSKQTKSAGSHRLSLQPDKHYVQEDIASFSKPTIQSQLPAHENITYDYS